MGRVITAGIDDLTAELEAVAARRTKGLAGIRLVPPSTSRTK